MCCKLVWPTLILIMKINMNSRKLLWPTIIGLFSVIDGSPNSIITWALLELGVENKGQALNVDYQVSFAQKKRK